MIYTYQCKSCKEEFDRLLSIARMHEPELEACPKCLELSVTKIMNKTAMLQFEVNMTKPTGEFRELLQQIKKNNKGSTIDL